MATRKSLNTGTGLRINNSTVAETIEQKVERIMENNEPIEDGAPPIYTERGEGVRPEHNIRTDKWELATEQMEKVAEYRHMDREERKKARMEAVKGGKDDAPAGEADKPAETKG